MISILSLVFGGLLRLAPELMKLFTQKRDQDHEHRMTLLQLEIDKARAGQAIDLVHAQAEAAAGTTEMQGWVDAIVGQGKPSGIPWIDALSSSVRPILTYWHALILYTAAKAITVISALQAGATLPTIAGLLVTEFDQTLIGSMVSFWFVDRSLRRK